LARRTWIGERDGEEESRALFCGEAGNQEIEETSGIDAGADLNVGRDLFEAGDSEMAVLRHDAFDFIGTIGDGFAASETTARFDVHVHGPASDERRIDGDAHGERVVHGRARATEFFREREKEIEDAGGEMADGSGGAAKRGEAGAGEERAIADGEADHGERPAGAENDAGGFGIVVDIGFGGGGDVAAGNRAAHDDDFADERDDGGVLFDGESDVGERADGDERDLVRSGVDELDDEIGGEARVGMAAAGRKLDIGEAVAAIPEPGGDEFPEKRMERARGDGNVAAAGEGGELEGVFEALAGGDVAGDDGDGLNLEFGRMQGEKDGESIVGAGIGINDDFAGRGESGLRRGETQGEKGNGGKA
jgi:hypothetical protein